MDISTCKTDWKSSFSEQSFTSMQCIKQCLNNQKSFLENDIYQFYDMKLLPKSSASPQFGQVSKSVLQSCENGISSSNIYTSISPQIKTSASYKSRHRQDHPKKRKMEEENSSPECVEGI